VLLAAGATKEVQSTLEEAQRLSSEGGSRYAAVRCRLVQVDLALSQDELDEAKKVAEEALELAHEASMQSGELQALVRLVLTLARRGDEGDEATPLFARAEALIKEMGELERAELVFHTLSRAYATLGREEEARAMSKRAVEAVALRLKRMKSPGIRKKFLTLPHVIAINEDADRDTPKSEEHAC
jgi:tetratricopeptide (TPR) repeat protein